MPALTSRRRERLAEMAMALGLSLAALLFGLPTARAQQTLKASVGYYPGALISLPVLVAHDRNFFETDGLSVDLVPIATGPAMTSAVASGSVTFVNNSWDNLLVAVEHGLPVRGVVGSTVKVPFALIARNGIPLPHLADGYPAVIKDLVGKKWGVLALGVSLQYMDETLLTDAGFKANEVTYLAVGLPATARPALQRGIVDTYLSIEPLPSIVTAKHEGTVVLDLAQNQGPAAFHDLGYNGWWASASTITKHPELVSRFVKAMEDSYCWYHNPANLDAVVAIMQHYAKVPELSADEYKAMVQRLIPTFGLAITEHTINTWSQLLLAQGQLHAPGKRSDVVIKTGAENFACPR
jgi:ABC-type nitrate/sulfonate/bicarbonate transport system substrate-binding protein